MGKVIGLFGSTAAVYLSLSAFRPLLPGLCNITITLLYCHLGGGVRHIDQLFNFAQYGLVLSGYHQV